MQGRCDNDALDIAEDICDICRGEFCAECLLFPRGRKSKPVCRQCAINSSGIRAGAKVERRIGRREALKRREQLSQTRQERASGRFVFFDEEGGGFELPEPEVPQPVESSEIRRRKVSFGRRSRQDAQANVTDDSELEAGLEPAGAGAPSIEPGPAEPWESDNRPLVDGREDTDDFFSSGTTDERETAYLSPTTTDATPTATELLARLKQSSAGQPMASADLQEWSAADGPSSDFPAAGDPPPPGPHPINPHGVDPSVASSLPAPISEETWNGENLAGPIFASQSGPFDPTIDPFGLPTGSALLEIDPFALPGQSLHEPESIRSSLTDRIPADRDLPIERVHPVPQPHSSDELRAEQAAAQRVAAQRATVAAEHARLQAQQAAAQQAAAEQAIALQAAAAAREARLQAQQAAAQQAATQHAIALEAAADQPVRPSAQQTMGHQAVPPQVGTAEQTRPIAEPVSNPAADVDDRGNWIPPALRGMVAKDVREANALPKRR